MRLALTFFALSVAACGSEDETWHGDTSFTTQERASIEAGAAFVAQRAGVDTPAIVWDGDEDADRRLYRAAVPAKLCESEVGCIGQASAHRMWITPDMSAEQTEQVAAHEFGHTIGLVHHEEPGLMNPAGELVWTAADEADARAHVAR